MSQLVTLLTSVLPVWAYLLLAVGAALENIVPPIPADTFVVLGGFLAAQGRVDAVGVFLVTWGANVTSALVVYAGGFHYGRQFFDHEWGRLLLKPGQLDRVGTFYERWGHVAIFLTRFLPGFRAVVPVFAGVTRQPFLPVAVPLVVASAIWYGALTWVGALAGRNLDAILEWVGNVNRVLLIVALCLGAALGYWWYRSRDQGEAG